MENKLEKPAADEIPQKGGTRPSDAFYEAMGFDPNGDWFDEDGNPTDKFPRVSSAALWSSNSGIGGGLDSQ